MKMHTAKRPSPLLGTLPAINKKGALLKDTFPIPTPTKQSSLSPLLHSPLSPHHANSPQSPFTLSFGAFELAITEQELHAEGNASHFVKTHKHKLCLQMLTKGHVESFVDFFYLTHKKSARKSEEGTEGKKVEDVPPPLLNNLAEYLTSAEDAYRAGDSSAVVQSYRKLASHFEEEKEYLTAIHFHQKGLELSLELGDTFYEASTYRLIGINYELLGEISKAILHFDRFSEIAQRNPEGKDLIDLSYQHLVIAYRTFADQLDRKASTSSPSVAEGLLTQAVDFYQKCLRIAQKCGDTHAEGIANHKLGLVFKQLHNIDLSTKHLHNYLEICKATRDEDGESIACSALADVYSAANDTAQSVKYLEENISLAHKTNQLLNHAHACRDLGVIYNQREDYGKAVEYFEKFYDLAISSEDRVDIDTAKVYLGVARGNLKMHQFFFKER